MQWTRLLPAMLFFTAATVLRGQPAAEPKPPVVTTSVDRPDGLYEIGQKAVFTIKVAHADGAPLTGTMRVAASLTLDGGTALADQSTMDIGASPQTIEHTMTEPGFVRLTAIGREWQGRKVYIASSAVAACAPERIEPVVTMPEDFDAFWSAGRDRLAAVPLDLRQQRVDQLCDDRQDTYKVSFANINDTRIHGYLLVPKGSGKKYPALIAVAPAGVGKPRENSIAGGLNSISRNEAVCLYMGVYDHDLGQPAEYYKEFKSPDGGPKAIVSAREDYFFYRAALGIDRAINWLVARDDVDPGRVVYVGSSQGGGMGLVLTGLNRHITAACVNIPGLCDHLAFRAGRSPGWPQVLGERERRRMTPEQIDAAAAILTYFDAVNFARRIEVPVLMTMGYADTTCPPSGVYAAYNVLRGPRQIIPQPTAGHQVRGDAGAAIGPWVRQHLGLTADTGDAPAPPAAPAGGE